VPPGTKIYWTSQAGGNSTIIRQRSLSHATLTKEIVVVLDCGATNLRAVAVDRNGAILRQASRPNETVAQKDAPELRIWSLEQVWDKLCGATKEVLKDINASKVAGVIVATWGADGAPTKADGSLAYPIISWQCNRTVELARQASDIFDPWRAFELSGYQIMSINTLFKFLWLQRNAPDALKAADHWLMMPALIEAKLGARHYAEPTSASTTMAMDLAHLDWSEELLSVAGLTPEFFPEWHKPGDIVGAVSEEASTRTGLKGGTPILAGGHDTQFALLGSGAVRREAVLSSGTWEILALRLARFRPTRKAFEGGLIFEADAERGLYDPQMLMMGSGVLEWVRRTFFGSGKGMSYKDLIDLGRGVPPGSRGVTLVPSFVKDSGPLRRYGTRGTILGLKLGTGRAELYRATLEGLSFQLRQALEILTASTGERPEAIRVVGGGSRNGLWNQIRADVTHLPIRVTSHTEATVLGAALVAFVGLGYFKDAREALGEAEMEVTTFSPGEDSQEYQDLFERYDGIAPGLGRLYTPEQTD